jgi:hypothetical protein
LHGRTADAFLSAGVPREQLRAMVADTELPWPVPDVSLQSLLNSLVSRSQPG